MPGYGDLSVRKTISRRTIPRGSVVQTPAGRRAKVIGHFDDGSIDLRYLDAVDDLDTVRLKPELVTLIVRGV